MIKFMAHFSGLVENPIHEVVVSVDHIVYLEYNKVVMAGGACFHVSVETMKGIKASIGEFKTLEIVL